MKWVYTPDLRALTTCYSNFKQNLDSKEHIFRKMLITTRMMDKRKKYVGDASQNEDSEFNLGARFLGIISCTSTFFIVWLVIILVTSAYQFAQVYFNQAQELLSSEETALAVEDGIDSAKDEVDFFFSDLFDSISEYF